MKPKLDSQPRAERGPDREVGDETDMSDDLVKRLRNS